MSEHIRKVYRFGKVYWQHPLDSGLWEDRDACAMDYSFCLAWQRSEEEGQ